MARPLKQGIDYFPMDVISDDKLKFIEIKFRLEGFAVVVKLYQRIYANGYYCNASEDEILLMSDELRVDYDKLNSIIEECLKREIFNKELYGKYSILTSNGIQKRYYEAVQRRKDVKINNDFMLFDGLKNINENKNRVNVNINEVNDNTMITPCKHDVDRSTQSKVNKTKVNKTKKENKKKDFIETINAFTSNEVLIDTIYGFIEMRKAIKNPITERGLKVMLDKLANKLNATTEEEYIKILENSIMNNWKGVFELKPEDKIQIKPIIEKVPKISFDISKYEENYSL